MIATTEDALRESRAKQSLSKNRLRQNFTKEEIHRILTEGTAVEKS